MTCGTAATDPKLIFITTSVVVNFVPLNDNLFSRYLHDVPFTILPEDLFQGLAALQTL